MGIKAYSNLDLKKLELENARLNNVTDDSSLTGLGEVAFNTSDDKAKFRNSSGVQVIASETWVLAQGFGSGGGSSDTAGYAHFSGSARNVFNTSEIGYTTSNADGHTFYTSNNALRFQIKEGSQGPFVVIGDDTSGPLGGDLAAQFNIVNDNASGISIFRFGRAGSAVGEFGAGGPSAGLYPNQVFYNTKGAYEQVWSVDAVDAMRIDVGGTVHLYNAPIIAEAYTLPVADGLTDQFIKTDGAGNLSFATITIPSSDYASTSGYALNAAYAYDYDKTYVDNVVANKVETVNSGNGVAVDNTDPINPTLNIDDSYFGSAAFVNIEDIEDFVAQSIYEAGTAGAVVITAGTGINVNNANPNAPVISVVNYNLRKHAFVFESDFFTSDENVFRGILNSLTETLTVNLVSVSYEARLDTTSSYTIVGDLSDLQTWITANVTGNDFTGDLFWIKCNATYDVGETGIAQNRFTYNVTV